MSGLDNAIHECSKEEEKPYAESIRPLVAEFGKNLADSKRNLLERLATYGIAAVGKPIEMEWPEQKVHRRKIFFVSDLVLQELMSGKTIRARNVPAGAIVVGTEVNFVQRGIDVMMSHESFPTVEPGEHVERDFLRLEKEST